MTNPPIPPAVVEAVARAIAPSRWRVMDGYLADTKRKLKGENASYDVTAFKDGTSMAMAQAALSAALATGSVVICSPELKALMDVAKAHERMTAVAALTSREARPDVLAHVSVLIAAAIAFAHATSQES